jgi:O-acetylserine/cysteine efflux transporter
MHKKTYGAVAALAASGVAWGTSVPQSKVALGWLPPGWLALARFALAAAVLLAIAARSGRLRGSLTLPVLASGAIGYGCSVVLQNAGLDRTSVTHASLIVGATPALVAIIAAVGCRAVARPVAWAGFALSLGGVGLIAGGQGHGAAPGGDLLVFASVLVTSAMTVIQGRLLEGRDPIALTGVQFLGAALATLPLAAAGPLPAAHAPAGPLLATLGLTITGTLVPFSLFAFGQKHVPAQLAGAFLNLEPLVGAAIGIVAFGDPAGPRQLGGGLAVLAGIALSCLPLLPARAGLARRPRPGPALGAVAGAAPSPQPGRGRQPVHQEHVRAAA